MKNDVLFAADFAKRRNGLNHANFVIHKHHRHQHGVGADGGFEGIEINQTVFLDVKVSDLKALTLEFTTGIEHSFMFGFDGDDVLAALSVKASSTLNCQII